MCTLEKRGDFFILTFTGDGSDEHRLSPELIASLLSALREVKSQATRGSVLITTSQGKFFSNGFDLAWARSAGSRSKAAERLHHMVESFRPIVAELISLPMPTVAVVQGHAAAAGFALALSHDYVFMRSDKGVLYMSEVDLGLPFPDYFAVLFRAKLGSVAARRDVLLGGKKVRGEEAVRLEIVDGAHDSEEKLKDAGMRVAEQLAGRRWEGEVYKEIRKSLYPELCGILGLVVVNPVLSKL
ncbi:Enoyl-CoA delta isomerase 2, peroxisomal [Linum perenne]